MLIADSTLLNCPYLNPNDCLPCFADGVIEDLAEGVRYMMSTPIAFGMVGLGFAFGFFGSSYLQVLPAFGKEVLNMNADGSFCLRWPMWDRWSATCSWRRLVTHSTRTGGGWA